MTGLLAIVADLGATGVAISSGRAAAVSVVATVTATVATAVGSAILGSVVLVRLLGELDCEARALEISTVQLLDCLLGVLLVLVINEGVISLW